MQASYVPLDLAALTVELVSSFRSAAERGGLELVVDCPRLAAPVYVDREMWEKIVLNLVSNAFKFTLEGSITVRLGGRDGNAVLDVIDSGVGIAPSELPLDLRPLPPGRGREEPNARGDPFVRRAAGTGQPGTRRPSPGSGASFQRFVSIGIEQAKRSGLPAACPQPPNPAPLPIISPQS